MKRVQELINHLTSFSVQLEGLLKQAKGEVIGRSPAERESLGWLLRKVKEELEEGTKKIEEFLRSEVR